MKFTETSLRGAWFIDLEPHADDRGFFARIFCANEFRAHGLEPAFVQGSISFNRARGTMRGMHFQVPPAAEAKIVRCTRGAIHDVIVDLRPDSPTYLRHVAVELTENNTRSLYIPPLFAHGFLTLEDNTEVQYLMAEFFAPACGRGARYNDPAFGISWPGEVTVISPKDATWPDFGPEKG